MAVSKRLRYEILRRDNHTCRYCGASAPDVHLTVDHVLPVALGGTDDPTNLVAACADCNSGKSSSNPDQPLVDQVSQDAIRWQRALGLALQAMLMRHDESRECIDLFETEWQAASAGFRSHQRAYQLPSDWRLTVRGLVHAGIVAEEIEEAVDAAMSRRDIRDRFAYFIGVCREKLRQREAIARGLIENGDV